MSLPTPARRGALSFRSRRRASASPARADSSARPRTGVLIAGAVAGAALAVAVPIAASAHVHVDPGEVAAGATETLTFSFSHGCDDSPTTALVVTIPDGVGNATPIVEGGWTISRELAADGVPTSVTFTADAPIESGFKAEVAMEVLVDSSAANSTLAFPVVQQCVTGATEWTQVAAEGEDPESLDTPAPLVVVGEAVAEDAGHGAHAEDAASTPAADAGAEADDVAAAPAGSDADPVARWIAGGALVAGIAAIVVSLVRTRSRRD